METIFYKYQGTGNDFVMIDNRDDRFPKKNTTLIRRLCDRRFGIGGDGLILLENDKISDFRMVYYNSDGNESSMCGNGGRCIAAFAGFLGIIGEATTFQAVDGLHRAAIDASGIVSLQMKDISEIKISDDYIFMDTGSPHHIQMTDNLQDFDVRSEGAAIRYSELYGKAGSNANFVGSAEADNSFSVRTYERGVEDETLSCGTGVTAVAIAMHATGKTESNHVMIDTPGGKLEVSFDLIDGIYTNVYLTGLAEQVFWGKINI